MFLTTVAAIVVTADILLGLATAVKVARFINEYCRPREEFLRRHQK
jgi:hypothetical protein